MRVYRKKVEPKFIPIVIEIENTDDYELIEFVLHAARNSGKLNHSQQARVGRLHNSLSACFGVL